MIQISDDFYTRILLISRNLLIGEEFAHTTPSIKNKCVFTYAIHMKGPKQKGIISLEIVAYWFCMTRLFILYSYLAMRLRDCVQH